MDLLELAVVVSVILIVAITAPLVVVFRRAFASRADALVEADGSFVLELGGPELGEVFLRVGSVDEPQAPRVLVVTGTLSAAGVSEPFEVRGELSSRGGESVRLVEVLRKPARIEGRVTLGGDAPPASGLVYFTAVRR
jgi:hypothetical protein